VRYFVYPTLCCATRDSADALLEMLRSLTDSEVYLVGHSLGGLVLRHLPALTDQIPATRMLTLATPHQGSSVVRRLSAGPGRWLFGKSLDAGLLGGLPVWPAHWELGSLAGTQAAGVGCLLKLLDEPCDGTITVAETLLDGMRDHICLPRSHANMLFCPEVAAQVQCFLNRGCFAPQAHTLGGIMAG